MKEGGVYITQMPCVRVSGEDVGTLLSKRITYLKIYVHTLYYYIITYTSPNMCTEAARDSRCSTCGRHTKHLLKHQVRAFVHVRGVKI
jgi:hypothetical protein